MRLNILEMLLLKNIKKISDTGINRISGAITHSAKSFDVGFKLSS